MQLRYYTITAPTAGIVGDVPARVGMQVSPQTVLTTIEQNDTLEVYVYVPVERSARSENRPAAARDEQRRPRHAGGDDRSTSSRRAWTRQTQSILVKGAGAESGRQPAVVAVRPRAHRLEDRRRARRAGDGGARASAASTSRSSPRTPDGKLVAQQRAIKVGPIVGDNYPVLDGLKPGEQVVVSGVAEARGRRADRAAPDRPALSPARQPQP